MADYQASLAGIALVPEGPADYPRPDSGRKSRSGSYRRKPGWEYERIYSLFPRLKERRKQEGTTLFRR